MGESLVYIEDDERINVMTLLFDDCIVLLNEDDKRKKREKKSSFLNRKSKAQQSRSKTKTRFTLFYKPLFLTFARISDAGKNKFLIVDGMNSTEFELETTSSAAKVEWMKVLKEAKENFENRVLPPPFFFRLLAFAASGRFSFIYSFLFLSHPRRP